MDRSAFDASIAAAASEEDRLAFFGALLARETRLGSRLIPVGGSALEIYLTSEVYSSQGIDVVGTKSVIASVLLKWGLTPEGGRSRRVYWVKDGLGAVDLVGARDRAGLPPRRWRTPHGEVMLGAVEYLIVRRLMRATSDRDPYLFRQAEALARRYPQRLDWEYMRVLAKAERVLPLLDQFETRVRTRRKGRAPRGYRPRPPFGRDLPSENERGGTGTSRGFGSRPNLRPGIPMVSQGSVTWCDQSR